MRYIVEYSGYVEVEAKNKDEAIQQANNNLFDLNLTAYTPKQWEKQLPGRKAVKHVRPTQMRSAFIFETDHFTNILKKLFGTTIAVEYALDGITVTTDDDIIEDEEIVEKLSEFFDVVVTSFHQDDCECPLVWVIYLEE